MSGAPEEEDIFGKEEEAAPVQASTSSEAPTTDADANKAAGLPAWAQNPIVTLALNAYKNGT